MAWTPDNAIQELTEQERRELESIGRDIIADIEALLKSASHSIKVCFKSGAAVRFSGIGDTSGRFLVILLYFGITYLEGSMREDVKRFIEQRLYELSERSDIRPYKLEYGIAFPEEIEAENVRAGQREGENGNGNDRYE